MRVGRRWLGGLTALVLAGAALGVMVVHDELAGARTHAAVATIPAWLPAMAGPVPAREPGPLGVDWLAVHPAPDLGIHADGAVLVDLDTREVLWARDPHGGRPPASLTKLLTAMVASDLATSLDRQVTVPVEATEIGWDRPRWASRRARSSPCATSCTACSSCPATTRPRRWRASSPAATASCSS